MHGYRNTLFGVPQSRVVDIRDKSRQIRVEPIRVFQMRQVTAAIIETFANGICSLLEESQVMHWR